jgi:hypothetical protein
MRVELRGGDETWPIAEPLMELVYPPEIMATMVWRDVTWAHADERVLVYDAERLVSHAGLYLRQGLHDGSAVRIGGIGGVMTHPPTAPAALPAPPCVVRRNPSARTASISPCFSASRRISPFMAASAGGCFPAWSSSISPAGGGRSRS